MPSIPKPLLRAVGLGFILSFSKGFNVQNALHEEKKPIFNESFRVNMQRCAIHIIPSCISLVVVGINLREYFIGSELAGTINQDAIKIAALQVAAKFQELLIISSTGAVLYHRFRHDLLDLDGIPFGLVGSGISFTQISFLWSPEFLAGLATRSNLALLSMVIISSFLASLAGPATAILIIPRIAEFTVGHAKFFVNGSADQLWPEHVSMEHFIQDCDVEDSFNNGHCPSGGYSSIFSHFSAGAQYTSLGVVTLPDDPTSLNTRNIRGNVLVYSRGNGVAPQSIHGGIRLEDTDISFAIATHGATTSFQREINFRWYVCAQQARFMYPASDQITRYRLYSVQRSYVDSQVPFVRTLCMTGRAQNINLTRVVFPGLYLFNRSVTTGEDCCEPEVLHEIDLPYIKHDNVSEKFSASFYNLSEQVPNELFATTGLVLRAVTNDTTHVLAGCVIDARWAKAQVFTQFPGSHQAILKSGLHEGVLLTNDSWRRINFNEDFLSAINFGLLQSAPGYEPWGTTALAAALANTYSTGNLSDILSGDKLSLNSVEYTIAVSFADALSRVSVHRSYNHSSSTPGRLAYYDFSRAPDDIQNWDRTIYPPSDTLWPYTTMNLTQTVTGYGFTANSNSSLLAIGVLLFHLALAFSHTFYLLFVSKRSSGSWDSVVELMALAMRSNPPKMALRNTGAGMKQPGTLMQRVRIQAKLEEEHKSDNERSSQEDFVKGGGDLILKDTNEKDKNGNCPQREISKQSVAMPSKSNSAWHEDMGHRRLELVVNTENDFRRRNWLFDGTGNFD